MVKRLLLGTLALFLGVSAASAQFVMSGSGAGPSYFLLLSKPVQKELHMTEEQIKKVQAKFEEVMGQAGAQFSIGGDGKSSGIKLGDGKGGDGAPKISYSIVVAPPKAGEAGRAAAPPLPALGGGGVVLGGDGAGAFRMPNFKKVDEELNKLLDAKQQARLQQLNLQRQGMMALAQEKVANDVGLHDEQRELIKQILQENTKKSIQLAQQFQGEGQFDIQAFNEQLRKQRESTEKDLGLLLSEEQKEKWEKLIGPKFDFAKK